MRTAVALVALSFVVTACEKKKSAPPPPPVGSTTAPAQPSAKAVKAIPDGPGLIPGLTFDGKAGEAIEWYKRVFGATELSRMPSPSGKGVMHANLKLNGANVFLGDALPGMEIAWPQGKQRPTSGLYLYVADVDATYKRAVEAGAKGKGPPQDMFWGDRYANLVDPFGHHWSVATHKEDVTPQEMARRGAEWAKKMAEKMQKK